MNKLGITGLIVICIFIVSISGCSFFGPTDEQLRQDFIPIMDEMEPLVSQKITYLSTKFVYVDEYSGHVSIDDQLFDKDRSGHFYYNNKTWGYVKSKDDGIDYAKLNGKALLFLYDNVTQSLNPIPLSSDIQATNPKETITIFIIYANSTEAEGYVNRKDKRDPNIKTVTSGNFSTALIVMYSWPEKIYLGEYVVTETSPNTIISGTTPNKFSNANEMIKDLIKFKDFNNIPITSI